MDQSYDVVLFGVQEDRDASEVAGRIASTFSMSPTEAESLIAVPAGMVFKEAVSLEDAERYLKVLNHIGARANYKPTLFGGKTLELVPKAKPRFVCPECAHVMEHDEGAHPPAVCPECGLVFEKYQEIQKRKQEADAVRDRLKKVHAMREEMEEKQQQANEEEQRRRLLEEQIRREMGLPAIVNKPWKLWSSAAITLMLGVGIGTVGGMFLFSPPKPLSGSGSLALENAAGGVALETVAAGVAGQLNLDGSQVSGAGLSDAQSFESEAKAQEQLLALSHAVLDQSAGMPGDAQVAGALSDDSAGSLGAGIAAEASAGLGLGAEMTDSDRLRVFLSESDDDPEWEHFLMTSLGTNLAAGAMMDARRLADHLQDPRAQSIALAHVAATYSQMGQRTEADALLANLVEGIGKNPTASKRVELLTAIVPVFQEAKLPQTASLLVAKAAESAKAIVPAGERAEAMGLVALAQARLGMGEEAQDGVRQTLEIMRSPMRSEQRARATGSLAEVFASLGALDNATKILEKAQVSVGEIDDMTVRDRALEELASAWARIGQLRQAIATSATLSNRQQRDAYLLGLVQERAFSGDQFGLSSLAEAIDSDPMRARAYAYLGVASSDKRTAESYFQTAIKISDGIKDGYVQIALQAEIARFMTRASLTKKGSLLFALAEKKVAELESDARKDLAMARLAGQRARALDLAKAEAYLGTVKNPQVLETARKDVLRVGRTIRYTKEATQAASS